MATATTQEFIVHLPQDVIEMVQQAASKRHATPDQIVVEALRFSLQPIRQEALQHLNSQLQKQHSQSEMEIREHLEAQLTIEEQERLSQLLERNRNEGLTAEEQAEMQTLFDRIEAVATEKAAAIWLLSGRAAEPDLTQ